MCCKAALLPELPLALLSTGTRVVPLLPLLSLLLLLLEGPKAETCSMGQGVLMGAA
jgi:hypothetical protein